MFNTFHVPWTNWKESVDLKKGMDETACNSRLSQLCLLEQRMIVLSGKSVKLILYGKDISDRKSVNAITFCNWLRGPKKLVLSENHLLRCLDNMTIVLSCSKQLVRLQSMGSGSFYSTFNLGYIDFVRGNWGGISKVFERNMGDDKNF